VHATLNRVTLLSSLVLLTPTLPAQWSPQWELQPAQISGYIVRDNNGAPIQGATVILSPPSIFGQLQTATTDSNGEYRFRRVRDGSYQIIASARGFIRLTYRPDASTHDSYVTVSAATVLHRIDFELVPEKEVIAENKPLEPHFNPKPIRYEPFTPNPIKYELFTPNSIK
jgi:Carboxypeptidase regulatory-like domain